jgi:hypothetical protein
MICSRATDDTSKTAQVRGLLSAMAHKAGCGSSKSPDQVCIYVSCYRVENLSYLYSGSPDYESNSLNSIEAIKISSEKPYINKVTLDVWFKLSEGPKPV